MIIESWLLRTPHGWVEPTPPDCPCGSDRYLIGWQACQCGAGPFTGGHRTWECRGCGARTLVGCVGRVGVGPMAEYGVRTGASA